VQAMKAVTPAHLVLLVSVSSVACCSSRVSQEATSSDGRLIAAIAVAGCGATTGEQFEVSIRRVDSPFRSGKDVIFAWERGGPVSIEWLGPKALRINMDRSVRFFRQESKWRDVIISYDRVGAPALSGKGPEPRVSPTPN
jgi:hypothetical protein